MDKNPEEVSAEEENLKEDKKEKLKDSSKELKEALDKSKDYYDQLLRLKAEFENYRKRVEKEKPQWLLYGKSELVMKMLPLYDILQSAHEHIIGVDPQGYSKESVEEFIKGLDMVFKEFSRLFDAEGIREIEPLNKPYDPMNCEIISVVDSEEENDGLVVEVLQKGYFINDKVLRPARVKIAKKKAKSEE